MSALHRAWINDQADKLTGRPEWARSMKTTLNAIRAFYPCVSGWKKLLAHLGKTKPDDEPLPIITVLESNGLDDALWCLRAVSGRDREIRLFTVWCARQVQHLMPDPRSLAALDVAERYARGLAANDVLRAARDAAWAAVRAAAVDAAWAAAMDAAMDAAWDAARYAQQSELKRVLSSINAGVDPYPAQEYAA